MKLENEHQQHRQRSQQQRHRQQATGLRPLSDAVVGIHPHLSAGTTTTPGGRLASWSLTRTGGIIPPAALSTTSEQATSDRSTVAVDDRVRQLDDILCILDDAIAMVEDFDPEEDMLWSDTGSISREETKTKRI